MFNSFVLVFIKKDKFNKDLLFLYSKKKMFKSVSNNNRRSYHF